MSAACREGDLGNWGRPVPGGGRASNIGRKSDGPFGSRRGSDVPRKPGNAGGGKGPYFGRAFEEEKDRRLAMSLETSRQPDFTRMVPTTLLLSPPIFQAAYVAAPQASAARQALISQHPFWTQHIVVIQFLVTLPALNVAFSILERFYA